MQHVQAFASVDELVKDVKAGEDDPKGQKREGVREPWSVELVRRYLARTAFDPDLFDTL